MTTNTNHVRALSHPLRVDALRILGERTASPSELADELGVPLPNLSYHVRMLLSLRLVKLVKTRPRRGAIEHYYRATPEAAKALAAAGLSTSPPELVARAKALAQEALEAWPERASLDRKADVVWAVELLGDAVATLEAAAALDEATARAAAAEPVPA